MKNIEKGTLYSNALTVYQTDLFNPLKEKLYVIATNMIRDDRLCKVVQRYKIKNLLKIFEEIDLKKAELIKEGDELVWKGEPTLIVINEYMTKQFQPEVFLKYNKIFINCFL